MLLAVSLIVSYPPTDVCELYLKEAFNANLKSLVEKFPQRDIRIVLGNFLYIINILS